jgi:hypothetical protein
LETAGNSRNNCRNHSKIVTFIYGIYFPKHSGEPMKKETIEESLGLSPKADYKTQGKDVEKVFKDRQDDRVELLEESISDIKQMIVDRGALHKDIIKSLENIDMFINNTMPKTNEIMFGTMNDSRQKLIQELLKKKIELDELKASEKLNFWRDVALLKKELREHMKEYRDMQSKTSMIDNLLEI